VTSSMKRLLTDAILIIFDYSGTLSVQAPRFAHPAQLTRALKDTGLAEFGIDTPELFWERIVTPTWEEWSRTGNGYVGAVVAALKAERNPHVYAAATRFVATYLAASPIHDDWFPLLTWLFNRPKLRILVATDHYAEATPWISQELARGGIPAIPLGKSREAAEERTVLIANSADLGNHKEESAFWEQVKSCFAPGNPTYILLIDDFGRAERPEDHYRDAWAKRRRETISALTMALGGS